MMKFYWLLVLAVAVADAAVFYMVIVRGNGSENAAWWTVLIIPLLIAGLIAAGIFYQVVVRPGRW